MLASGADGEFAATIFPGWGSGTPNPVFVTEAGSDPRTPPPLDAADRQAILWAKTDDPARTDKVWVEIREPGLILEQEGENRQTVKPDSLLLIWNGDESRYEAEYPGFSKSGKYTLFFYAKDRNSGIVSPFLRKDFYKAVGLGDISGNGGTDLGDALLGLKISCGEDAGDANVFPNADVNSDGKIGLEEVIFILQEMAGDAG